MRDPSKTLVKEYTDVKQYPDELAVDLSAAQRKMVTLDLTQWTSDDCFQRLVAELCVWKLETQGLVLQCLPQEAPQALSCVAPPKLAVVDDDDAMAELISDVGLGDHTLCQVDEPVDEPAWPDMINGAGADIPEEQRRLVVSFIESQTFSEQNRFTNALNLRHFCNFSHGMRDLVCSGIVTCRPDIFGEPEYALNLAAVRLSGRIQCSQPQPLANMPVPGNALHTWPKLDLVEQKK